MRLNEIKENKMHNFHFGVSCPFLYFFYVFIKQLSCISPIVSVFSLRTAVSGQ